MRVCSAVLALACLGPTAGSLDAQISGQLPRVELAPDVQLEEADHVARAQLEQIERFLQDRQWEEAVEALRRLMETGGSRLLPVGRVGAETFVRYVPLRTFGQMRLARLSRTAPEALELYRRRVDPLVEQWYQQGVTQREEAALRRIADRFLMSRWGAKALLRLGELALERGDFTQARAAWQQLDSRCWLPVAARMPGDEGSFQPLGIALQGTDVPSHWDELAPRLSDERQPTWLACPDGEFDFAHVLARLTLVSLLEGSPARAKTELQVLTPLAPELAGTLAARRGKYVDLLGELLQQSRVWPPVSESADWSTFGGATTRAKVARAGVDPALQPIWKVPLPRRLAEDRKPDQNVARRVAEDCDELLSYHPLVVGGTVLLAAGPRLEDVHAFDLRTGQALWPGEAPAPTGEAENLPEPSARLLDRCHQFGVPRFTMTATGNMLLVKLGPQATSVPFEERRGPIALGQVAALDLTAQKKLLFEISLKHEPWGPGWAVEGPPVADGQHLYVAVRRRDNLRAQAHVACFGRKHGELRWRRSIVAGETPGQGQWLEYTHNLLTLDQGMLYYNTNLGATAALRADDGEMVWLVRYPRAPFDDENPDHSRRHWYRDLNPCVVAKELVLVAPADCDRIFALDATTGMLLWTTEPQHAVDAVHVLGVSGNHLIASGDRIYWIDVRTGRITTSFPMRVEASLRGYGRGLLTGDAVYWPTRERIFVFAQDGSRQTRQPIELGPLGVTGGNLVISDETLLIAGATQLVAFNPYGRQVPQATGGR